MKLLRNFLVSAGAAFALLAGPGAAVAQNQNNCAWPLGLSPSGSGNFLAPDDAARYWAMPFPKNFRTMKIQGTYPNARYFSFVAYSGDVSGRPVDVSGSRHDTTITPDGAGATYTVRVSRDPSVSGATNGIPVTANDAWVLLRVYGPAPDPTLSGLTLSGGVPLPAISLDESPPLVACPPPSPADGQGWHPVRSINKFEDLRAFFGLMFPAGFDINQPTDFDEPVSGRLWFAPPRVPPILLLPNPDNKYIAASPGPYQRGRVVVIRAKAPAVAERRMGRGPGGQGMGHSGGQGVDLRYWSLCNNIIALPVPAVGCVSDLTAKLEGGWFTVVVSDDLSRPDWLRPGVNWLSWGDEQYPKLFFFRHLLASEAFPHSIQQVVKGCPASCLNNDAVFDFALPDLPRRAAINAAGPAVQRIMGEHYPVATWCDKSTFERGGWQACLRRP